MLNFRVTISGDKEVSEALKRVSAGIPAAINRGLVQAAKGVYREAFDKLSGPGAKKSNITAGGYPVPVRTGHLRSSLNWLKPGESKSGEVGSFSAGPLEVVIYNSAKYARYIHQGEGSSAKFGARPFLTDALTAFNQGAKISHLIEKEIRAEITQQLGGR
jgi:hypothetical protein